MSSTVTWLKSPAPPATRNKGTGRSPLPYVLCLGGLAYPKSNVVCFFPNLLLLLWALVRKMASAHHPVLGLSTLLGFQDYALPCPCLFSHSSDTSEQPAWIPTTVFSPQSLFLPCFPLNPPSRVLSE